MKNLWLFFVRYNAFFWFILFFTFSLFLVIKGNDYQKSRYLNSSNRLAGNLYNKVNSWKEYIALHTHNESLTKENATLRAQLQKYIISAELDSVETQDSLDFERYQFIPANVTNNSIHQKNNYLTLDKGTSNGIEKGMGVIAPNGVVGIIREVSLHFSTVQSLLHRETKISVTLDSLNVFGSLVWGSNTDSRYAMVRDIPNHLKVDTGTKIFTSGFSLFPQGIEVGEVVETDIISGESFMDIRIRLTTDFASLRHVYLVKDVLGEEKKEIESLEADG